MLDWSGQSGQSILRFYEWSEPTLSLGYFQAFADRAQHPPSLNCVCVRRASGGGAILHHQELTYSLAIPFEDRLSRAGEEIYNVVHNGIVSVLSRLGIEARLCERTIAHEPEPFLCFHRRSKGDVICAANKIAGSAQRRGRRSILQHGSVLLARSELAPELAGVSEISRRDITRREFESLFFANLKESIGAEFVAPQDKSFLKNQATELETRRFANEEFIFRR